MDNFDKLLQYVEERLSEKDVDGRIDMGELLYSGFMDDVKARAAELGLDADEVAMQLGTAMEGMAEEQAEGTLGDDVNYVESAIGALVTARDEILGKSE